MKRENILVMGPCTRSSTTCMCVQGGIVITRWEMPPTRRPQTTREAGQDSQAVFTQEARVASQAGSLPRGRTRRVLLDMTNPPWGTSPRL